MLSFSEERKPNKVLRNSSVKSTHPHTHSIYVHFCPIEHFYGSILKGKLSMKALLNFNNVLNLTCVNLPWGNPGAQIAPIDPDNSSTNQKMQHIIQGDPDKVCLKHPGSRKCKSFFKLIHVIRMFLFTQNF